MHSSASAATLEFGSPVLGSAALSGSPTTVAEGTTVVGLRLRLADYAEA